MSRPAAQGAEHARSAGPREANHARAAGAQDVEPAGAAGAHDVEPVGAAGVHDAIEGELLLRVLSALLREDAYGLRSRARPVRRADGDWLCLALPDGAVALPVEADGFQCEVRARRPVLETQTGTLAGLPAVLGRLRAAVAAVDRPGYDAFLAECEQEVATLRSHAAARPGVVRQVAERYGPGPGERWRGLAGALVYDTLAAHRDHPVYPTGRTRPGLSAAGLRGHAPEFHPEFALRWLAVPRTALRHGSGPLPDWWPTPSVLGLTGVDDSHTALPVHPLTVGPPLTEALRAADLEGRAALAPRAWLRVRPTLSTRTVAVVDDPAVHLKLPLATATLGGRNRRTIKPGTLVDGAAGQRLTAALIAREPRFAGSVLLADEHTHLHAGHELLAALVRRYPAGLDRAHVVPLAALLARCPDGSLVIDALADRYYGGDLLALVDAYLRLLFDWHVTLFGYGVGLEAHQQNTSLVLDEVAGRPRLRLLIKDHDGPRVYPQRLAARLAAGPAAILPGAAGVVDAAGGAGTAGVAGTLPAGVAGPGALRPDTLRPGALRPDPLPPGTLPPRAAVPDAVPVSTPAPRPADQAPADQAPADQAPAGDGPDPFRLGFDDPRILVDGDGPVADVFTTIAVHLCAGAPAFELARLGRATLGTLLDLVAHRLTEAIDHLPGPGGTPAAPAPPGAPAVPRPVTGPTTAPPTTPPSGAPAGGDALAAPGSVLRERLLRADRLPVKAMVTAGTLLTKERSGAADINKHYVSGPNYLLRPSRWSR